ncbi:uncharacterized protein [Parasteatoda tepidariorum]|uniref:uncharacterized protein n=1 Tax=Parasteatoda tepidariorum TaxID=114398 RepID=UPI001C719185|nr:uncharacterized protein LOC122270697 [Parasteatoda tepidariorum]
MERELVLSGDQVNNLERQMTEVKHRLGEKDEMISQLRHENREIRSENHENRAKMQEKLANEKDKMKRIMERRLAEKQAELEGKLCFSGEKFRLLREILNAGEWDDLIDMNGPPLPSAGPSTVPSDSSVPQTRSKKRSSASESSVTEVKMTISRSSNGNKTCIVIAFIM